MWLAINMYKTEYLKVGENTVNGMQMSSDIIKRCRNCKYFV